MTPRTGVAQHVVMYGLGDDATVYCTAYGESQIERAIGRCCIAHPEHATFVRDVDADLAYGTCVTEPAAAAAAEAAPELHQPAPSWPGWVGLGALIAGLILRDVVSVTLGAALVTSTVIRRAHR